MRIIETEVGRLVGRVDRVRRIVVWALVCGDCEEELTLTVARFRGDEEIRCKCGWKLEATDFDVQIETAPTAGFTAGGMGKARVR